MNINERIKLIRKDSSLTQDEFAKNINISRANIGSIEIGRINVTDRVVSDISETFNVNELWLRTGEGEMYRKKTRDEAIVEWAAKITRDDYPNEFAKRLANILTNLNEDEWASLEKIANRLLKEPENKKNHD